MKNIITEVKNKPSVDTTVGEQSVKLKIEQELPNLYNRGNRN